MEKDASGLTFEEWDPTEDVDSLQMPVMMIINSTELRAFTLQEIFSQNLRPRRARVARAAWGFASLSICVLNVSCYRWMMTLSLGHVVHECVFAYFGVISQKNNEK